MPGATWCAGISQVSKPRRLLSEIPGLTSTQGVISAGLGCTQPGIVPAVWGALQLVVGTLAMSVHSQQFSEVVECIIA